MITSKKSYIYSCFGRTVSVWVLFLFFASAANAQTIIVQQPQNAVVCASVKAATFTVEVNTVYTDAVYQWYEWDGSQFVQISVNSTNASYTATKPGEYRCVVYVQSNSKQETSASATLSYINLPSATGIEAPAVCNKTDLHAKVLGVAANGSNITYYEWKLGTTIKANGAVSNNTIPDLIAYVDSTQHRASLKIILENGCGRDSVSVLITVNTTPEAPTIISKSEYCQDDTPETMAIAQENPTWYRQRTGGTGTTVAPVPSMDEFTPQTWWVSQTINYGTVSCEGYRAEATVIVKPRSPYPTTNTDVQYCLNDDTGTTLGAQGQNVKWYGEAGNELQSAPQINTSVAGVQTYYVTQTVLGACESQKQKVTVTIKDRADESVISVPNIPTQCPYNVVTIQASANVTDPVFRWYKNNDKSDIPFAGNPFVTPVLTENTTYYVTLEYAGHCESLYPKTVIITVEDNEKPTIVVPENVVVSTNDGVCYATNVQTGRPVVSDNCTPADKLNVFISPAPPAQYPLGSTTITWWVADTVHNTEKDVQSITVKDMELPKGTCPEDIEIVVNNDVDSVVVNYNLSYTDNCDVVKITRTSKGYDSGSFFPVGETIVVHEITDTAGNVSECRFKVLVRHPYRALEVALRASAYEICSGQAVTLTPVVSGGSGKYTYTWKPRPSTTAFMEDYPLATTRYEVTINDGLTSQTKSVDIAVLEPQQVKLEYDGRMDEILEGDEVLVKATPGFASYKFLIDTMVMQEVGSDNQLAFMAELGTYIVRVFATDINYCVVQDQLAIYVESKKLPNVFTPNQDGKNEIFLEGYDLMVFSRAGELLYKGIDGWTGFYKGKPLPQGTYLYVVRRTMNNGEFRVYKGTVTLKR